VRTADDWRQKALQDPNEAAYVLSLPGSGGPTTSRMHQQQQQQQQQQHIYQLPPGFEDGSQYQVVAPQYQTVLSGGEQYTSYTLYAAPTGALYQQPQHGGTSPGRHAGGAGDVAQLSVEAAGLSLADPGLGPLLYQGGPPVMGRLPPGQQLLVQQGQQFVLQGPPQQQQQQQQQQPVVVMLPNGQLVQLQQGLHHQ
jgi:hypothetical protein